MKPSPSGDPSCRLSAANGCRFCRTHKLLRKFSEAAMSQRPSRLLLTYSFFPKFFTRGFCFVSSKRASNSCSRNLVFHSRANGQYYSACGNRGDRGGRVVDSKNQMFANERKKRKKDEDAEKVNSFVGALRTEVNTLWPIYMQQYGSQIEGLKAADLPGSFQSGGVFYRLRIERAFDWAHLRPWITRPDRPHVHCCKWHGGYHPSLQ